MKKGVKPVVANLLCLLLMMGALPGVAEAQMMSMPTLWKEIQGEVHNGSVTGVVNSHPTSFVPYKNELYAAYVADKEVHVKRYNENGENSEWVSSGIDGQSVVSDGEYALNPQLAVYQDHLYVIWEEEAPDDSGADSGAETIRVKRYNGTEWETIQDYIPGENRRNINANINVSATHPSLLATEHFLYATWTEFANGEYYPRVSRFDGSVWTSLDGWSKYGLYEKKAKHSSKQPRLAIANQQLYAAWVTDTNKVRVMQYEGSEDWTFVDDGGIKYGQESEIVESQLDIVSYHDDIYLTWIEATHDHDDFTLNQIRMQRYDGDTWEWVDGGESSGLNFRSDMMAFHPRFQVYNGALYLTWTEEHAENNYVKNIRVQKYDGEQWSFVDGAQVAGLNHDPDQEADKPTLFEHGDRLHVAWREEHDSSTQRIHVKQMLQAQAHLQADEPLHEGNLDESTIQIYLEDVDFNSLTINEEDLTLLDAPYGVTIETVQLMQPQQADVTLKYDGTDFDADHDMRIEISHQVLSIDTDLITSPMSIIAHNDSASLSLSQPQDIWEGKEDGKIIIVNIDGGTFAHELNAEEWMVENLPNGVEVGSIERSDNTTVHVTLVGNGMDSYPDNKDIDNVSVTVPPSEYHDANVGGGSLVIDTGIVLNAIQPPGVSIAGVDEITQRSATITAHVSFDGGAEVTERGIQYREKDETVFVDVPAVSIAGDEYIVQLDNLLSQVEYEVRAYATNTRGRTVSEVMAFRTEPYSGATLEHLEISPGTLIPAFTPEVVTYDVYVEHDTDQIRITATAVDHDARLTVNEEEVHNGIPSAPIPLMVGDNTIEVQSVAPDGVTLKTYTLNVQRAVPPSDVSNLTGLRLSHGTLEPDFSPERYMYDVEVAYNVTDLTVTAEVYDPKALLTVNEERVESGQATSPISLDTGENNITITVTAEDGIIQQQYMITVVRLPSSEDETSPPHSSPSPNPKPDSYDYDGPGELKINITDDDAHIAVFTVDEKELLSYLEQGQKDIDITIREEIKQLTVELPILLAQRMSEEKAQFRISTMELGYVVPFHALKLQQAEPFTEQDKRLLIQLAHMNEQMKDTIANMKKKLGIQPLTDPVRFYLSTAHEEQVNDIQSYAKYFDHFISLNRVDCNHIDRGSINGMLLRNDGTFTPVLTSVRESDDACSVQLKSMSMGNYVLFEYDKTFEDIQQHWAQQDIEALASRLVIQGVSQTEFLPHRNMTRAEFVTLLVRALGIAKEDVDHQKYLDVHQDDWFASDIQAVVEYNIVKGYEDGTFRPHQFITRQEAMTMLFNALNQVGINDLQAIDTDISLKAFTDYADVANWSKDAMTHLVASEIVVGEKNELKPKAHITRAEVVTIVNRVFTHLEL
ncbi:cadherin-like beta sandwich domain-containing protein [Caldalkalibacillus salinus]|uniref:cadherin-like beta sandwich domain-containing protein n=1 Tax=Caldalkalibacillus salinus TaxID=2803787 RepID=UPI0019220104|nr:cadherin-like beta sandwich domain-containing protein [Caldalkalibacillus salinus]